jgi:hypothetical protein
VTHAAPTPIPVIANIKNTMSTLPPG